MQLWTAALLVGVGAARRRGAAALWAGATILTLLSIDETARLHERLAAVTASDAMPITGIWPLVLGPALLLAALAVGLAGRRWWREDRHAAALLGTGLVVLVASAAGVELLSNVLYTDPDAYFLQATFEETGELLGGTIILAGAWRLATRHRLPASDPARVLFTRSDAARSSGTG